MKPWKIIAVAAFAIIAIALTTTTAFAYIGKQATNSPYGTYNPYGYGSYGSPQGPRGGMMRRSMGGMMGSGYSPYGGYQANPQQTPYGQQYGPWTSGYDGCPMRNGRSWP
jgi:hypothetical protein